jgi:hypothetical protein
VIRLWFVNASRCRCGEPSALCAVLWLEQHSAAKLSRSLARDVQSGDELA